MNESTSNRQPPTEFDKRAIPSPFRSLCGMRITEWARGRCVIEVPILPELRNFSGALAGPVIGAAIDAGCSLTGCYTDEPNTFIKAISLHFNVIFIGSARGESIRAVCVKTGGGRKIYSAAAEVFDDQGIIVATGQGTFRYISE